MVVLFRHRDMRTSASSFTLQDLATAPSSYYCDSASQHGVIRELERKHARFWKVRADDQSPFLAVADFTKALDKLLKSDIGPDPVDLGHNLIAPHARAPSITDDKIRV